jgi:hypothetical protein
MTITNTECPDCRGKGTVYDQVEWSDGLGGVTCTCSLCDGKGSLDVIAALRRYKRDARQTGTALEQLRKHVLCYVDTSDPARAGNVRGMPGASPFVNTWLSYLKAEAAATAARLSAEVRDMERRGHEEGHHAKAPPPWPCALTNARAYCPLCPSTEVVREVALKAEIEAVPSPSKVLPKKLRLPQVFLLMLASERGIRIGGPARLTWSDVEVESQDAGYVSMDVIRGLVHRSTPLLEEVAGSYAITPAGRLALEASGVQVVEILDAARRRHKASS